MITEKIGGYKIERFNSIEELPINRHMTFNRLAMVDAGIGATIKAIDAHDKQIIAYARSGDTNKVIQQTLNRNKAMNLIIQGYNPNLMCYVTLIKSINGEPLYDLSDENLKKVVDMLGKSGKQSKLTKIIDDVKKSSKRN